MKPNLKNFLAGIGSAIVIFPAASYAQYVPKQTPSERIGGNWVKTGQQLRAGIEAYNEKSKTEKTSST